MTRPESKDINQEVEAAIRAVAAEHGWHIDGDDPIIGLGTAIVAMLEAKGYLQHGPQENVVKMLHQPSRATKGLKQGPAPLETILPYPARDLNRCEGSKQQQGKERPRLRDTEEWHSLSSFIKDTGKSLILLAAGALVGIYLYTLMH